MPSLTNMATYVVPRPNLTWKEKMYLPSIFAGMMITISDHLKLHAQGRDESRDVQYPEQKWDTPACPSTIAVRRRWSQ